jgi:endonuclease/exonuclease/phosphatase family metal-dependent hydrolase
MRQYFTLLFLLLAIIANAQTRVMTYNIRNSNGDHDANSWENRKASLLALIRKVNPDILGTQEVLKPQLKYLKTSLNDYQQFGVGRNDGKHKGEHSAIFFKTEKYELVRGGNFWLSETPNVPGSKGWDAGLTRICSWVELRDKKSGVQFLVFNTHFDHKGKQARVNSANLLRTMVDSLAGEKHVIVTGDFNSTPDMPAYTAMTATGAHRVALTDAYNPAMPNYTDCGFNVSNTKCNRIDYIFYGHHYKAKDYTLYTDNNGTSYPSDHLTISVVLESN